MIGAGEPPPGIVAGQGRRRPAGGSPPDLARDQARSAAAAGRRRARRPATSRRSTSNDPPAADFGGSPLEPMQDFFGTSQGSPVDLDAVNAGPFTDGSPVEDIGDFLVLVMEVEPTATQGVLGTETLTFAYDEI